MRLFLVVLVVLLTGACSSIKETCQDQMEGRNFWSGEQRLAEVSICVETAMRQESEARVLRSAQVTKSASATTVVAH